MDVDSAITKSFEKLGFVSIKEEQYMDIKAFVNGRDMFLYVCLPVLANHCVKQVYQ